MFDCTGTKGEYVDYAEKLWNDIFAVADKMKSCHADSRRVSMFYQITVSQLKMVRTVYAMTGTSGAGITLKNLAKQLGTTAAAASEMVDVLVRKKILERRQDPSDRRQVQIRLVRELCEHFKKIEEGFTALTADFLRELSSDEQKLFGDCISRFNAFIDRNTTQEESSDK